MHTLLVLNGDVLPVGELVAPSGCQLCMVVCISCSKLSVRYQNGELHWVGGSTYHEHEHGGGNAWVVAGRVCHGWGPGCVGGGGTCVIVIVRL